MEIARFMFVMALPGRHFPVKQQGSGGKPLPSQFGWRSFTLRELYSAGGRDYPQPRPELR